MKNFHKQWFILSVIVLIADQVSKYWAEHILQDNIVTIFSWLNFSLVHNPGAAFGFLSRAGGWQHVFFIALACVICVVLVRMVASLKSYEHHLGIAYSLIIAGAIGNVIDRIVYQYVVDFIHIYYLDCDLFGMRDCHYPHFNIADSAIFIGAFLIICEALGKPFLNTSER